MRPGAIYSQRRAVSRSLTRLRRRGYSHRAINSAAATNIELAVDCGVLRTGLFEIAGVLRRNVPRVRLAVADWRAADQSRFTRQR